MLFNSTLLLDFVYLGETISFMFSLNVFPVEKLNYLVLETYSFFFLHQLYPCIEKTSMNLPSKYKIYI